MNKEEPTQTEARWAIDLNWLKSNNRSFSVLARDSLCTKCRKKLKTGSIESKAANLLKAIQNCCSKSPGFIIPGLPIQESIFRVFLADGNKPLTLEELSAQLNQKRGINVYYTSATTLSRLLKNDQYYGIKPVSDNY